MFRMQGTIYKNGKMLRDCVSRQPGSIKSRTEKVLSALTEICEYLDLAVPIWLDKNIREFQRKSGTRFRADSFVETIGFDYLEITVIEE